jgi:hypothetical protein
VKSSRKGVVLNCLGEEMGNPHGDSLVYARVGSVLSRTVFERLLRVSSYDPKDGGSRERIMLALRSL